MKGGGGGSRGGGGRIEVSGIVTAAQCKYDLSCISRQKNLLTKHSPFECVVGRVVGIELRMLANPLGRCLLSTFVTSLALNG